MLCGGVSYRLIVNSPEFEPHFSGKDERKIKNNKPDFLIT